MFDAAQLFALMMMGLVVGSIAVTVTKSKIFADMREWVATQYAGSMLPSERFRMAPKLNERFWKFVHGVTSCPYCFGHWLSFGLVAYYQPRPVVSSYLLVDLGVSAFALITLGACASAIILKGLK